MIDNGTAGIIVDERVQGVIIERNTIVDSGRGIQRAGIHICQGADVTLKDNHIEAKDAIVHTL